MKEQPILFSSPMVKAILNRDKTKTRRIINFELNTIQDGKLIADRPLSRINSFTNSVIEYEYQPDVESSKTNVKHCHYRQAGDLLWIKETHYLFGKWDKNGTTKTGKERYQFSCDTSKGVAYFDCVPESVCTKKNDVGWFKRSSLFMPRWASRVTLEITGVKIERVQDITEEDAIAEGFKSREDFITLWCKLNGTESWNVNKYVWVLSFNKL
jgi:hypothetical protein